MAEMNSVFIVLAAIATVCAVLVLPTITPLRRQPGESGWDYYLRIYWIPGSAVVIAVAGWLRGLGVGFEDLGLMTYLLGTAFAAFMAIGTVARREHRGY